MNTLPSALPRSGTVDLDKLLRILSSADQLYDISPSVEYSIAAYRDARRGILYFAGRLIVGVPGPPPGPQTITAGALYLIRFRGELSDISSSGQLAHFLTTAWGKLISTDVPAPVFPMSVQVSRHPSSSAFADVPNWHFTILIDDSATSTELPQGPFFDPNSRFFASSVGSAAAEWLGIPHLAQLSQPCREVYVTLRDERAYLGELRLLGSQLTIFVQGHASIPLHLAVLVTDYEGKVYRLTEFASSNGTNLEIPLPARALEIFLLGGDGFCFDSYSETQHQSPQGVPLLRGLESEGSSNSELKDALIIGESERIEFKAWLPTDRKDKKSFDILKSVCAFANTDGGTIWVGVNNELEVQGCEVGLSKLQTAHKKDLDHCRQLYPQLLQRILAEGLSPTVPITMEWVTHAGLPILRIQVPKTKTIHSVVEQNIAWVRRGASVRKAIPADFVGLLRASSA